MASNNTDKEIAVQWIKDTFPTDSTILDVGANDGKWKYLLEEYHNMDAVEAYWLNIPITRKAPYRKITRAKIEDVAYDWYDLIIFGDVIEHMSVETAQKVLEYALPRCKDMLVVVPFKLKQDALYGNPYEIHIQDDLTASIMKKRYPYLEVLHDTGKNYCYYHKRQKT